MMSQLDRVLLVGFMAAGKTRVGARLAKGIGWRFVDFDQAIERSEGRGIPEIFASKGEPYFREVEARVAAELLTRRRVVLAAGGGWAAVPGRLESVPTGTGTVWLKVSPRVAVERSRTRPGGRPLLEGGNPVERATALLAEREPAYAAARWAVDTEGRTVDDVSARILEILVAEHPEILT